MVTPLAVFGIVLTAMTTPIASPWQLARSVQSTSDTLSPKIKIFERYAQDFLNMAKSYQQSGLEFEIAMNLHAVADRESERLDSAKTLLIVYEGTSCQTDRALSRSLVIEQLSTASKRTKIEIDDTQNSLTYTKMPGVAALAVRMKDDLQDTIDKLDQARNALK